MAIRAPSPTSQPTRQEQDDKDQQDEAGDVPELVELTS
jgi:hypothetical protein